MVLVIKSIIIPSTIVFDTYGSHLFLQSSTINKNTSCLYLPRTKLFGIITVGDNGVSMAFLPSVSS